MSIVQFQPVMNHGRLSKQEIEAGHILKPERGVLAKAALDFDKMLSDVVESFGNYKEEKKKN